MHHVLYLPRFARKFKKAYPSKKDSSLVHVDEEPITKGKRVKRSVKKSSTKPGTGIVIRKPHVETKSKRKEKVDVTHGKGIDLLSEVALTEEAQMKEVRKKSLRDFYKTHPSGSGTVAEKPPRVDKITPTITSEGTGDKPGVPNVTEDDSTESELESWGNDEDDNNDDNDSKNEGNDEENKNSKSDQQEYEEEAKDDDEEEDKFIHTPSNSDDEEDANMESKNDDKSEGDEDRGMDDTTNQFSDDVQDKEADETEVLDPSFSYRSDLGSKFLNFSDIHPIDAEIVSPLDVHVHHEVPRIHTSTLLTIPVLVIPEASLVCTTIPQSSQTFTSTLLQTTPTPPPTIETTNIPSTIPDFALVFQFNKRVIALEKDVAELKKDPLHTQVTALVDDHLDTRMGATRKEFVNFLSASLTDRIIE
nr:hypothetical protein [Tanacetum cinerariifolium]